MCMAATPMARVKTTADFIFVGEGRLELENPQGGRSRERNNGWEVPKTAELSEELWPLYSGHSSSRPRGAVSINGTSPDDRP